eukprot:5391467-Prymnesium_polylepis.2
MARLPRQVGEEGVGRVHVYCVEGCARCSRLRGWQKKAPLQSANGPTHVHSPHPEPTIHLLKLKVHQFCSPQFHSSSQTSTPYILQASWSHTLHDFFHAFTLLPFAAPRK